MKHLMICVAAFVLVCGYSATAEDVPEEATARPTATAEEIEFFENRIRPMIVKHCAECHAADSKVIRGGLRLDDPAHFEAGGDSGDVLSRAEPSESLLLSSLKYETLEMPPSGRLPDNVIADFETWILAGAPLPPGTGSVAARSEADWRSKADFWSFQPLRDTTAMPANDPAWNQSEIDRFVWAGLQSAGLMSTPVADQRALARRLSYDLTGLPPDEADLAVLGDAPGSPEWQQYVDRLLASPQFGVQWGRHWLDVARYADSNGGDINLAYPHAWRYRDYVIDSFNADKPFNRFIREQIAGDLLPADSVARQSEQMIATGFLMIGSKMISERDKEKLRMDVVDEQIDTVGKAFLGMTLGCARCHDHKFDPIPTADYYALAGIFRSTQTVDGIRMNNQFVSGWRERELPLPPEQAQAVATYRQTRENMASKISEIKQRLKNAGRERPLPVGRLAGIVVDDDAAEFVGAWPSSTYSPLHVGKGYRHDDNADKGEKQAIYRPMIPEQGIYEIRLAYSGTGGRASQVPVVIHAVDGEHRVIVDQSQPGDVDGLTHRLGRFLLSKDGSAAVTIETTGTSGHVIADAVQFLTPEQAEATQNADDQEVASLNADLKTLEQELKELDAQAPTIPVAMAVSDVSAPFDCEIRIRGEVHQTGPKVDRGFPRVFDYTSDYAKQISGEHSGRVALADWVVDPANPLTPRVTVNRIWQKLFGEGLVRSVDNFGHLGEQPTHPELLDHLAISLVKDDWSVKRLIRKIVLSRAYRSGSAIDPRAAEVDPDNRLLAHHARRRLTAESIRDSLLFVSGELETTLGGPSLTTKGEKVNGGDIDDVASRRRSVYLPLARGYLPSMLTVFDYPNPNIVTGKRPATTVPAQALLLMNSDFVRERAGVVAANVLKEPSVSSVRDAVTEAFTVVLQRTPQPAETEQFVAYITSGNDQAAVDMINPESLTDICHVLLASNEFRFID